MAQPDAAITDNLHYLEQARALVASLSREQFTHTHPPLYKNGLGPHLRHCLDHYELFSTGLAKGMVDYDQRQRRETQQAEPEAMLTWIGEQSGLLRNLCVDDLATPLKVKMDCGSEMSDPWSDSSVLRELQFLISHTVHHFALIAMILHDQNLPVPAGFGVAPSTLKYEADHATCAR